MHRSDVKKITTMFFIGVMVLILPFWLQSQAQQDLEIHYINVQQGQSTLIIGPNGTTILFDGGNEFKGTTEVVPYLQGIGITTSRQLDYIIASHHDTDHYMGLTEVMNYGYDVLHVYDNGSNKYNTFVQAFLDAAAAKTAGSVLPIPLGLVIDLGNGATATCVAANGYVIGTGLVPNGQANENDRSVVLLIKYGNFEYIVTGDLGGGSDDYLCTGRSTSQVNIESPLIKAIMPAGPNPLLSAYGVEVAHVGHHGSESSTNAEYMNILTPQVGCISVGTGQSTDWFHPRIDVVEHVLLAQSSCITASPALVLQTEEGSPTGEKTSYAGYCVGDFVISTNGVNSYTITANGAVSQGPDERTAAGLPLTFYFEEYTALDLAPLMYDIHSENVTRTSADILWSTNEAATSVVRYGTTSGSYPYTASSSSLVLNHSISLSGLTAYSTYYYIVESTDATNHTATSQEYTFQAVNPEDIKVVISEAFYDTPGTDSVEEWIELYNNSPVTIDLGGWKIIDNMGSGSAYTIPTGTFIAPATYLTVAVDSTGFQALYGYNADLYGTIPGLNNTGDSLVLTNKTGTIMDAVAWEGGYSGIIPDGWGSTTLPNAGTGFTVVRSNPTVDTDTYSDWTTADNNGYPQTQAMNDPSNMKVVFSEVYYDTIGVDTDEEWIELYNNSPMEVNIGGWTITDNNGSGAIYTIPQGTVIASHTYLTLARTSAGFNALYGYNADVYGNLPPLNNDGDALILKNSVGTVKDTAAWEGGASGGVPTGWGSTTLPNATTGKSIYRTNPTTDTDTYSDWGTILENGFPQTQQVHHRVVFSEVFYDTPGDDAVEEWIELYNNSPVTVNIGGWKIIDNNGTGGIFTIPSGYTMLPHSHFTVAANSTGFTALYWYNADLYGAIPALNNDGDALVLKDNYAHVIDFTAWEGGASAGVPTGWGSTTAPSASIGNTIVRTSLTTDTNTYSDWSTAAGNGNPQAQTLLMTDTITMTTSTSSGKYRANATITVTSGGSAVSGAVVAVTWSGTHSGTSQGTTDSTGKVILSTPYYKTTTYSFTVTINSITKTGYLWNSPKSETTKTINN